MYLVIFGIITPCAQEALPAIYDSLTAGLSTRFADRLRPEPQDFETRAPPSRRTPAPASRGDLNQRARSASSHSTILTPTVPADTVAELRPFPGGTGATTFYLSILVVFSPLSAPARYRLTKDRAANGAVIIEKLFTTTPQSAQELPTSFLQIFDEQWMSSASTTTWARNGPEHHGYAFRERHV